MGIMAPSYTMPQGSLTSPFFRNAILGSFAITLAVLFLLVRRYYRASPTITVAQNDGYVDEKASGLSTSTSQNRGHWAQQYAASLNAAELSAASEETAWEAAQDAQNYVDKCHETQHFPVQPSEQQLSSPENTDSSASPDPQVVTFPQYNHGWTTYDTPHARFPVPLEAECHPFPQQHPPRYDSFSAGANSGMLVSPDLSYPVAMTPHPPTLQKETIQMFSRPERSGKPQKWRRRVLEYG